VNLEDTWIDLQGKKYQESVKIQLQEKLVQEGVIDIDIENPNKNRCCQLTL
jgi:hypothetical protein